MITDMDTQDDQLWVEKYRPHHVKDCILPKRIKNIFSNFVASGKMPNLMLNGSAGTGKTTIARALCEDMGYECILLNASKERGIDTIRTTIQNVASTMSIHAKKKAIILDEADGLTPDAQAAIKAAFEEHTQTNFILTCNNKHRLIAPIHSRTSLIDFKILSGEFEEMRLQMLKRCIEILKTENVTFDMRTVAEVVKKFYPDNRKILNILQTHGPSGGLNAELLKTLEASDVSTLLKAIKERDLRVCRQWIADNKDEEAGILLLEIYDVFSKEVVLTDDNPNNILELIDAISECNARVAFAVNPEVNLMGLVGRILRLEFKD